MIAKTEPAENGSAFRHRSVLLEECIEALRIRPDGVYVDGTAGGGGHSFRIASCLTTGRLIAIDRDAAAIAATGERLSVFGKTVSLHRHNFSELSEVLAEAGVEKIDGMLLDLGVSSYQLDTPDRGFSFQKDAPLDMRMDRRQALDARTVVNTYGEAELRKILYDYGEERFAPRIVSRIIAARAEHPLETTGELVRLVEEAIPAAAREKGHHPATRTFQAIRIEVNGELGAIEPALREAVARLNPGGRLAVITFHSLEDRIVKQTFAALSQGCVCPRNLPVCVCNQKPQVKIETKKPILPSPAELEENPRSRSAKLRVATKSDGTERMGFWEKNTEV